MPSDSARLGKQVQGRESGVASGWQSAGTLIRTAER